MCGSFAARVRTGFATSASIRTDALMCYLAKRGLFQVGARISLRHPEALA
jgi:hypothetical protein